MSSDDFDAEKVRRLMRRAVLCQRSGGTRVDNPEASFRRGRTRPVADKDLAAARRNARRAQDEFLRALESRARAVLAEVEAQRAAWDALQASGNCLYSELLTVVQDEDPGRQSGWDLYGDNEGRTFED